MTLSALVVDDDETIRETLSEFLRALGHTVRSAPNAAEARRAAAAHACDVALVDLRLPDADGLRLLEALRADDPDVGVIVLSNHADVRTAVRATQLGAVDFLEKPVDLDTLQAAVARCAELVGLRRELSVRRARDIVAPGEIVPPQAAKLIDLAARNHDVPVLLLGEIGTGKGFVARRIHSASSRRAAPFMEVNCAAVASSSMESELFGHERGAFTDARQATRGLVEVAGRGTLFLDEVGELTVEAQTKLLGLIDDRSFRRVGGTTALRCEARMIAATNRPLDADVRDKHFRGDLYYRLQVLTISLPPLRQRVDEIPALAASLLPRGATLAPEALPLLERYQWPGNIRELENVLWRASILSEGAPIRREHLALQFPADIGGALESPRPGALEESERRAIRAALTEAGGNKTRAAQILGIARSTLQAKLRKFEQTQPH